MKNEFNFNLLENKKLLSKEVYESIFFKMLEVSKNGGLCQIPSISGMINILNDDMYYVAHNLVSYKGKKAILKGKVILTSKDDLIVFLYKSTEVGDMRELLISPLFDNKPNYVISISEDNIFLYTE
ncbi:hypothetical protein Q4R10_05825 [Morganella morganii]